MVKNAARTGRHISCLLMPAVLKLMRFERQRFQDTEFLRCSAEGAGQRQRRDRRDRTAHCCGDGGDPNARGDGASLPAFFTTSPVSGGLLLGRGAQVLNRSEQLSSVIVVAYVLCGGLHGVEELVAQPSGLSVGSAPDGGRPVGRLDRGVVLDKSNRSVSAKETDLCVTSAPNLVNGGRFTRQIVTKSDRRGLLPHHPRPEGLQAMHCKGRETARDGSRHGQAGTQSKSSLMNCIWPLAKW